MAARSTPRVEGEILAADRLARCVGPAHQADDLTRDERPICSRPEPLASHSTSAPSSGTKTPAAPAHVSACSRSATTRMTAPRSGPAVATACCVSMTAASRSASRVSTRRVWRQPVTSRAEAMIPSAVGVTRTENQRLSGAKKPSNSTSVCSTIARNASA